MPGILRRFASSRARNQYRQEKAARRQAAATPTSAPSPTAGQLVALQAQAKKANEIAEREIKARHAAEETANLAAQAHLEAVAKLTQAQIEVDLSKQYIAGGKTLAKEAIARWLGNDSDISLSFNFDDISVADRETIVNAALAEARTILGNLFIQNPEKALELNRIIVGLTKNTPAIVSQETPLVNGANFLLLTGATPTLSSGGVPINDLGSLPILSSVATPIPAAATTPIPSVATTVTFFGEASSAPAPAAPNTVIPVVPDDDGDYVEVTSTMMP
jgi:hypothetical protein